MKTRTKIDNSRNMNLKFARRDKINLADSCNSRNSNTSGNSSNRINKIFGSSIKESSIASKIIESSLNKFKEREKIKNVKLDQNHHNVIQNICNEEKKNPINLSPKSIPKTLLTNNSDS